MAAISNRERLLKDKVIDKCWKYLDENFHKFNQKDQIKILIALCAKSIPQEIEGGLTHTVVEMPVIRRGGAPLEFSIGTN